MAVLGQYGLFPISPVFDFYTPLKTSQNLRIAVVFRGVKWNVRLKWVNEVNIFVFLKRRKYYYTALYLFP